MGTAIAHWLITKYLPFWVCPGASCSPPHLICTLVALSLSPPQERGHYNSSSLWGVVRKPKRPQVYDDSIRHYADMKQAEEMMSFAPLERIDDKVGLFVC